MVGLKSPFYFPHSAVDSKCGLILPVLRIMTFIFKQYGITKKNRKTNVAVNKIRMFVGVLVSTLNIYCESSADTGHKC